MTADSESPYLARDFNLEVDEYELQVRTLAISVAVGLSTEQKRLFVENYYVEIEQPFVFADTERDLTAAVEAALGSCLRAAGGGRRRLR